MFPVNRSIPDTAEIRHEVSAGILEVFVSGPVTVELLVGYAESHLDEWANNKCILWNLQKISFVNFSLADYKNMSKRFGHIHVARKSGKAALLLIAGDQSLGDLVSEYSKVNESLVDTRAFSNEAEARNWLGLPPDR